MFCCSVALPCRLSGCEWAYELGVVGEGDTATLSLLAAAPHAFYPSSFPCSRLSGREWAYELGVVDVGTFTTSLLHTSSLLCCNLIITSFIPAG
jgi:hypothetical protein